ncbi:lipoprotein lipase isoform X2 [Gouania willdenowi]|uniref:lipoprotein lipase isoform X2 n=1 Tax=Gouania willdenowi TaxID=441366 RepID=UPI0010549A42|nr:lipoprotein lipase-like isoform X2 [Gouania willdenowi]
MRLWQTFWSCVVLLNAAVQDVNSLEQELSGSILGNFLDPLKDLLDHRANDTNATIARFSLRKQSHPEDDLCYIVPGKPESLAACTFNSTSKTILVIHGWTLSGMFESWLPKLVSALYEREQTANVIVVDWLESAQNHYVLAAQKTQVVGQEIARFIDWIEETTNMPLQNIHLIGYSLGAHVAGFAGSHATNKVGRITGLDPAGPDFEGEHAHRRLSPDDAHFVDVLHTFTRGSLGLSIGIQQPVGHVDIYPNGGGFQPGCNLRGALEKIANFGIFVYHYQLKIHFSSKLNISEMEPSLTVSLYGTKAEAENMELKLNDKIMTNKTHSFLLVTEKDIGDLLMLKFKWEKTNGWSAANMLKMVSSWWTGDSDGANMEVHKIRIRAGETQQKMVFCVKDSDTPNLKHEVTFVKCKDAWRTNSKRAPRRLTLKSP